MPDPVPFEAWAGPRDARTVLVGEAFGAGEDMTRQPFSGEAGKEAWRIMGEAWPDINPTEHQRVTDLHKYDLAWVRHRQQWLIDASCAMTNVFNLRPPGNKIDELCCRKNELPHDYPKEIPALVRAGYVQPSHLPQLNRLYQELAICRPNLVVALGNTACWALLRSTNIGSIRGTTTQGHNGLKILPTYHPAAVLRQWSWRVLVIADLMKARREATTAELTRPSRRVIYDPELADVQRWVYDCLSDPPPLLACDVETSMGMIDTIGFARSPDDALVNQLGPHRQRQGQNFVTIWPRRHGARQVSYWSEAEERQVWRLYKDLLESSVPKVFQNGLYDIQYLLRTGIRPRNCLHDTMLLHHSLFPEMQKSLGFLGSIYTNEPAWKLMRRQAADTEKRDE